MATGEQIKSLIRSHWDKSAERFASIALQVAAHEAHLGHGSLAQDIRNIVDEARSKANDVKIIKIPPDLSGMVLEEKSTFPFSSIVLPKTLKKRLQWIISEYHQKDKLKRHGLSNRRKILLSGLPGTGKTMTARVLAHELKIPLFLIQVDRMVSKFMGETNAKLRLIFDLISAQNGIYLFDEFDTIGGDRMSENDVGEMKRVLNAFLLFLETDKSGSIIVCATNSPDSLDRALFRRFDDILQYELPGSDLRKILITNLLTTYMFELDWNSILESSKNLSHSEIESACHNAIKQAVLSDRKFVDSDELFEKLQERQATHYRQ